MGSRSQEANLTCVLSRCTCVPSLVILGQIFLEILNGNRFRKVTLVTLKMRSRSHRANLTCVLPRCTCVPRLVILGQIFLKIMSGNRFRKSDPCDLKNGVKVTEGKPNLCPSKVHLCTKFRDPRSNISRDNELKPYSHK